MLEPFKNAPTSYPSHLDQPNRPCPDRTRAARIAREMLVIGVATALMLTLDHSFAAAGIVTKLSGFCTAWIKPIYLGVLAFIVLVACYQGFVAIIQEEGNGGRKIGMALIGGAAAVLVPAAILAAVATGSTFAC